MKDYDYIVLIDENGQPYIEHSIKDRFKAAGAKVSSGVKSAGRKAHKYILKIGEGAKAKYAYTKEEADALLGRGRKAVEKVPDKVKGAREALSKVPENVRDSLGGREEKRRDKAREGMIRSSRDAGRAQARLASDEVAEAKARADADEADSKYKAARDESIRAESDTAKAIYKATGSKDLAEQITENARDFAKRWPILSTKKAEELHKRVVDANEKAVKDSRDAGRAQSREAAIKATGNERNALLNDMLAEFAEKEASDKVQRSAADAKRQVDWAKYDKTRYEAAENAYSDTPLAKIDSLVGRGKEAFKSVKDRASETLKSIKDAADKAPDSIKDKVSDAYDSAKERVKDALGYDEKERYEKAKDKYASAIEKEQELAAKKYPIQRSFFDFDTEMFEKYGRTSDYKEKMTNAEREKYDKLEKELTDISEEHWTAFKDTMWAAARQPETARDIYDKAFSEYMATPIARLDALKRKIKKKW